MDSSTEPGAYEMGMQELQNLNVCFLIYFMMGHMDRGSEDGNLVHCLHYRKWQWLTCAAYWWKNLFLALTYIITAILSIAYVWHKKTESHGC